MKILLTGSEGNLGTYLARDLKRLGHDVLRVALDLDNETITDDCVSGDLTNERFVRTVFAECGIDSVMHCAARLYGVGGFNADVFGLFQNDVRMMLNMLNAVTDYPVKRFLYMSSSMVYERSVATEFVEDMFEDLMPPKSSYGLTKFIGERTLQYYQQQYPDFAYSIWRPFNIVSPLETYKPYAHAFVDLSQKILVEKHPVITFIGDGTQKRCFTWVEDTSRVITDNLFSDFTKNDVYNVGQTELMEIRDVAHIIADYGVKQGVIEKAPEFRAAPGADPKFDVKYRRPSVKKLNAHVNTDDFISSKRAIEMYLEQALVIGGKGEIAWKQ